MTVDRTVPMLRPSTAFATMLLAGGAIVGTRWSVALPLASVVVWPLLAVWWWRRLRSDGRGVDLDVRAAFAMQIGFVATMFSLYFSFGPAVAPPLSDPTWPGGHPPFGAHPVTAYAGLPWPGVEGCAPHAFARDQVPFDMGVDAMLLNFVFWSALAFWSMRRISRAALGSLIWRVACLAPLSVLLGVRQLAVLFD